MSKKRKARLSVVVAVWKDKGDEIEAYSSLESFLSNNPGFKKDIIVHYMSRKKVPYETDQLLLTRVKLQMKY